MIVSLILLGVFVVVSFGLWLEGPWSGLIMLLNILLAASLATAWYPAAVSRAEPFLKSYTYLLDFVALQGLFCLFLLFFREITDRLSRTRVRFRRPVELVAGPLVAVAAAWVMVCFTAASLHTAPVPRDFIQPTPETKMFFGFAPDRRWLAWVRGSSLLGPFGRPQNVFDPKADFILRYADRRRALEGQEALRVPAK